jgi:hypothetical protein
MINRIFFWVSLAFLVLFVGSLLTLIFLIYSPGRSWEMRPLNPPFICGGGCSGGNVLPPTKINEFPPRELLVEGEWPKQMDNGTSDSIVLALAVPKNVMSSQDFNLQFTPTPSISSRVIVNIKSSEALDVDVDEYCSNKITNSDINQQLTCFDNTSLNDVFGPGYKVFASAHLITTSFDVQLIGPTEQSTHQGIIYWNWNIFPKSSGTQIINADIELVWKPISNGGEDIIRQFWQSPIIINVNPPPFFTLGQVTLSTMINGAAVVFFGGLSLPWIYEQRKKRKEETEKNKGNTPDDTQRERLEELVERERLQRERLEELVERDFLERERLRYP